VLNHTTSAADVQRVRDVLEHADPTIAGPARRVEVIADDDAVAERAADFSGELAALDWGAGYGYARIAAARTVDATTLLTFPAGSMTERARRHPEIAREIRRVGLRRLERDAR
jgi:CRP-like cAMP-binding protein